ncbi:MAG: peptidylprolyl isomerase [Candidatus Omnitrophica bacterium]|nr:peptidylprolyl isomerase [Candidatus Omnitrophota bacterium]
MRRGFIGLLSVFLTIGIPLQAENAFPATLDKVIVVVNGETITQGELDQAFAPMFEKMKMKYKGEELSRQLNDARKEILNTMVEEKLILSVARNKKIEAGDPEVAARMDDVKSKFDSGEKFAEALKEGGITLAELKQKYAEQIIIAKLIDAEVRKKIVVSPSESLEYYEAHKEEFREPEQVKLRNILIRPDEDMKDTEARVLSEKILGFLKAGDDFDELALKYSKGPGADDGGDLGFVSKGQMLKEIEDVVFNLPAGQYSDVVKTRLGYHIFKVEEKKPKRIKDIGEVRSEVEKIIFSTKGKQMYKTWVEDLKKNAYISFR